MIEHLCRSTRRWQSTEHSMPPMTQGRIRCTRLTRPRQSMSRRVCLSHRRARSSNSSVRTGIYLRGVQPTCQVFPGNSPSTLSNYFQMLNQSSKQCAAYPARKEPQSKPKSTDYSQQVHQRNQEITMGGQPRTCREEAHRYPSDVRRFHSTQ